MKTLLKKYSTALIILPGLGLSTGVLAGGPVGSITYGPLDTSVAPVPGLGGGALIALAVLLAIVAFRVMRTQQHKGVSLVVALTAIMALGSGVGGISLVSDAWAVFGNIIGIESVDGGEGDLREGYNELRNLTDVPQEVKDITVNDGACEIVDEPQANGGAPLTIANGGGVNAGECSSDSPKTALEQYDYCTLYILCNFG